jgi:hypothetical protein
MKLPRPYVPIGVKVAVAGRQVRAAGLSIDWNALEKLCSSDQLRVLLNVLYPDIMCHLDHEPPLMLRDRTRLGGYKPDANDPDWLIWRTAEAHRLKTFVRGDGAQLSDAGKRRKEIKRRKKATRPKRKWPSRPMRGRPP